jgi:hypothetical protein
MPQLLARLVEVLSRLLIGALQTFLQFPARFIQLPPRFFLRFTALGSGSILVPPAASRSSHQPDHNAANSDPPLHARLRM